MAIHELSARPTPISATPVDVAPGKIKLARRSFAIQAKLVVGAADDPYEREADRVADAVMASIQRRALGDEPAAGIAMSATTRISRLASTIGSAGGTADTDTEQAIASARSGGKPLGRAIRRSMENAIGADFGRIRLHVDQQSDDLNQRIQARAFTTGSDVFVRREDYAPDTAAGQRLLAHELTHTVQQGASPVIGAAATGRESGPDSKIRRMSLAGVIQRDDESDAKALELSDRTVNPHYGHALGRHGPGVSDDALKKRLRTGEAPDGEMVPVAGPEADTGISSKFASHREYLDTRIAAHTKAKSMLDATADHLLDLADKFKVANEAFAAAVGKDKAGFVKPRSDALNALTTGCDATRLSKNGDKWAPIDLCAKAKVENLVKTGGDSLNDLFTLRDEYELVIDHGRPIGYGFQGSEPRNIPKPAPLGSTAPAKEMRVFADAAPVKLDMPKTRSTFKVQGNKALRPKAYTPATWSVIQHFPADDPVGMRIKGAT